MSNTANDCIFCKIIANEIPSYTIFEDEIVKAFLDLSQVNPGHVLVIPKKHLPDIYAYNSEYAGQVFARVPVIARAIRDSNPQIKGMNICLNNGKIAYQTVLHSHIHLIPRYSEQDGVLMKWADNTDKYDNEKLTQIAQAIQSKLGD
ncbi:HIT family protein [Bombilactobacillus thymidiniphilus]|uniref:HIT family protein n=1 Tax=Bombilactobacillus thymidiniphilus TaxID=2923363 RepID=A0ABY4PC51_9LACO|nr:HIT family protein [Bombilactobacillus thymidiniphilus]UQS83343.1 HIT family protein [Bombilactobacillus thymidiniphilus]